jgi:hypothetical protein
MHAELIGPGAAPALGRGVEVPHLLEYTFVLVAQYVRGLQLIRVQPEPVP